jgi:hypothetical protein
MTSVDNAKNRIKQKLQIAEGLFNFAYSTKYFQLKKKHPEWSHQEIHQNTLALIDKGCA